MSRSFSRAVSVAAVLTAGSLAAAGAALASGAMPMPGKASTGHAMRMSGTSKLPMAMSTDMPMDVAEQQPGTRMDMSSDMAGDMPAGDMTDGPTYGAATGDPSPTAVAMRGNEYGYGYHDRPTVVQATLRDVAGRQAGWVRVTRLQHGGSLVQVRAWNLTPGFHGFHLHVNGICDPAGATPFAGAGGHFNPTGTSEGMQAGAFPVLLAGRDGRAAARFVDLNIVPADLVTPTGTSVVVHALPDNYANIPPRYTSGGVAGPDQMTMATGDGGQRVACGVLVAPAH